MQEEFIPLSIREVARKYNAELRVTSAPAQSNTLDNVSFAEIEVVAPKIAPKVQLVHNSYQGEQYEISAVIIEGNEFSDESPDTLLAILCSVLKSGLVEKKSIFGKRKKFVIDDEGNEYWPHT